MLKLQIKWSHDKKAISYEIKWSHDKKTNSYEANKQ